MFEHLLVPLDGSRLAEAAIPAALQLASRFESSITLIQVTHSPYASGVIRGEAYHELSSNLRRLVREDAIAYLKWQQLQLQEQGYRVHIVVEEGDQVADWILSTAEESGCDTIVMSTHGRGGLRRWIFGSVADKVLRQANVPIVLIRAAEQEEEDLSYE